MLLLTGSLPVDCGHELCSMSQINYLMSVYRLMQII